MSLALDPSVYLRDFVSDGISASGRHEPRKAEIRQSLSAMRQAVIALLADADPGLDLPNLLIRATDTGDGTPNAIQATTNLPVPAGDATGLIALNIFEVNTGSPVTVSFNGGTPLTVKSNTGNDIVAGGLAAGMIVLGFVSGSTFRIVTDQVSSAIVAEVEALLEDFQTRYLGAHPDNAAATAATGGAPVEGQLYFNTTDDGLRVWNGTAWAAVSGGLADDSVTTPKLADDVVTEPKLARDLSVRMGLLFDAVPDLVASTIPSQGVGSRWKAGIFEYTEVATDGDIVTAGGVELEAVPSACGTFNILQTNVLGDGSNDHPAIQRMLDSGRSVVIEPGAYRINEPLVMNFAGQKLTGTNPQACSIYSPSTNSHDLVRVRGTQCEIAGLYLSGGMSAGTSRGDQTAVIRLLGGIAHIHDNRLNTENQGQGVAILTDDAEPVTLVALPGGGYYFHNIERNRIGHASRSLYAGFRAFNWNVGLHATRIMSNYIICNNGVMLGGNTGSGGSSGNVVAFNTLQSQTGTQATPVGNGVDIAPYGGYESIYMNYIEKLANGVIIRHTNDALSVDFIAKVSSNTFDNCTMKVRSLGTTNYVFQDP